MQQEFAAKKWEEQIERPLNGQFFVNKNSDLLHKEIMNKLFYVLLFKTVFLLQAKVGEV